MPSKTIPFSLSSKTREGLSRELLKVQIKSLSKVKIISIYFDSEKKEHVLWYFPYKNFGGTGI